MGTDATTQPTELRILLADDHAAAKVGMRRAIEPHGIRVVAEPRNTAEALALAHQHQPDVCVIAVGLPGNGIEAVRMIKQAVPQTKLVVTTVAARDEEMFAALRAGADGYLLMTMSPGRLGYALRGVARGEAALPRQMTAKLILEFRDRGTRRRLHVPATGAEIELTAREFEVLERLRRRQRTAEIAAELSISEVTVRRHVSSIMQKLGTHSRQSALQMLEHAELQAI